MVSKKEQTNNVFNNISDTLNTEFEGEHIKEIEDVKTQLDKCSEIIKNENSDVYMDDGDFIRENIKSLITNIETAMNTIQQDVKIGAQPRTIEVFGQLANAKTNAIKELITMNKILVNARLKEAKNASPKQVTINNRNLNISSSNMLKMVKEASEKNSLKGIKATFKTEET